MPVAGADRLNIMDHIAIMDLLAAGKAALLPSDDLMLATVLKSPLIGVNNRNLKTFELTLDTTRELSKAIPDDRFLVCESGLHTPADLADMAGHGARAFLIGESLMRQDDVAEATRSLLADAVPA